MHVLAFYRLPEDHSLDEITRSVLGTRFCRREFLTEAGLQQVKQKNAEVEKAIPITELGDKFWFCQAPENAAREDGSPNVGLLMVWSTAEIADMLDKGFAVKVISGPHLERRQAVDSMEAWWEHDDF